MWWVKISTPRSIFKPPTTAVHNVSAIFSQAHSKTRRVFAAGTTALEDGRSDVPASAGVRFFGANGLSGGFEYSKLLLRKDFTEHSFQLNVKAGF